MMLKKNYAGIDLGSNSCKLLICDETGKHLCMKNWQTRLAEGMYENNKITKEAFERGRQCFFEYRQLLDKYDVTPENMRAITTAACRTADNGEEFVKTIFQESGIKLEIIDGFEEAVLTLKGAIEHVIGKSKYVVVYDLGGGSTEVTLATNAKKPEIITSVSIPWGARTASEAYQLVEYDEKQAKALRAEVDKYMDKFLRESDLKHRDDVCFVSTSSTPLRLVSMIHQFGKYDRERADGLMINTTQMDEAIEKLFHSSRKKLSANPYVGDKRSYIFIAACVIFQQIYKRLGLEELTASLKNAKDGIVTDLIERDKGSAKAYKISERNQRSS